MVGHMKIIVSGLLIGTKQVGKSGVVILWKTAYEWAKKMNRNVL